jgi:drug/metabolite transporter (DMT)-like permease
MLTPLVTAIANKLLFRQNAPRALPIALFFAVAGSVMVIVGNWLSSNQAAATGSARDTAVGLALATVSMFLLAAYLLLLQATQKLTTGRQVMWANVTVAVVVFGPLGAALEGADWAWVAALRPADWAVLFFAGFFINALNTIWTQSCSRVLGAAVVALFISCRLVSSLVGSIILLREIPGSPLTWAGFGVVIAAMSGFMVLQYLQGRRAEAAVADEPGAAAEQGSCEGSHALTIAAEGGAGGTAAAGGAAGSPGPEVRQETQRTSTKGELPV